MGVPGPESERRPCLRDDLVVRQVEDETVVYDPITDVTVVFNVSAAAVIALCDGTRSLGELADSVQAHFQAGPGPSILEGVRTTIEEADAHHLFVPDGTA